MNTVTIAFLRYLPRRRALTLLQLLGIAFGVASAVGMTLSARAALASFSRAVEFVQGRTTHQLTRPAGSLDEDVLQRLMHDPAVRTFSPVIDRNLRLPDDQLLRVLGVDPFLDRDLRPTLAPALGTTLDFLFTPNAVLADADLARERGWREGQAVETSHGSLQLAGTFPNPSGEALLLVDLVWAQELFGLAGRVDRVDLILDDPEGFRQRWTTGYRVRSVRQNRATTTQMLRAFRLNLEALSLLGLFVGVFLVYNTATFAVVSRRRDAGILRSLGADRAAVGVAFLSEILLLGVVGGLLGAALGYLLSQLLTGLVGGAISNIYFFLEPTPPRWSWAIAAAGAALGVAACLLGSLFPLLELMRTDPVRALGGRVHDRRSGNRTRAAAGAGAAVVALSATLFPPATLHIYWGFAGAFGLLVGASLVTGWLVQAAGPHLERLWQLLAGLPGRVAAGNIHRNLGRTAVAVAAFSVALSMSVGLGLMIGSFRDTLVWWMQGQLTGEVYVAPSAELQVPEAASQAIAALPGVAGVDRYRNTPILYRDSTIYLSAVDARVLQEFAAFSWEQGGRHTWDAMDAGAVAVSESFRRRFGLQTGDLLTLRGVAGDALLPIAGVFYDYTTEHGLIMMDRTTYGRIYADTAIDSLGVFLDPQVADREQVLARVQAAAREFDLPAIPREELYGNILEVFDATFAVTRSMRSLAVVVAFLGIAGALLTLYMERQRDFGIYRALGFSTPQVALLTLLEGVGMGLLSFALCTVLGTVLAFVLIRVINLQSFNWTVFFHFSLRPYGVAAATALVASAGAAAYPIWKVWRTFPQMQIREE